ncbi:chromate efflux transporter [Alkalicaulis satelles]|uniref:Chromate efflux transporter n=1 Tax=Alkalicaulis satelles TaxID=2609175 RepID=A0A5M6ZDR3_9PROT|nr:chromate efflux transporter [Alkalicaulis satelles]KAA5802360.1 chromate efflux transporter [Alkalicaulis satelles]
MADGPPPAPSLAEAVRVWARIGLMSFGGPAGQIALMHRILVEEKRWISEQRFLQALNVCMLLPGPEAQQLSVYAGWMLNRTLGGLIAGLLFILPGAAAILALSLVYVLHGQAGPLAAVFFGLKAAVLAIIIQALMRMGARVLKTRAALAVALAAFVAIAVFNVAFPAVVIGAALIGFGLARAGLSGFDPPAHGGAGTESSRQAVIGAGPLAHARPSATGLLRTVLTGGALWLAPVGALVLALGPGAVFSTLAVFFSQMAVLSFGGAYAVLAWVAQAGVETYGWLEPGEMLDGLALAETTPGPLILVLQFVAFLAGAREAGGLDPLMAGALASVIALWVLFTPSFVMVLAAAPFMERLRAARGLGAALGAVTAAVTGVIASLALWFAQHALFAQQTRISGYGVDMTVPAFASLDPAALVLTLAALIAVLVLRAGIGALLGGCALAGIMLAALGWI